ncbi:hypothetical protein GCM10023084_17700 [Streptomyces lacrimifluminis]|uniref:Uncharacterized protein n=1 Tax=Streptomyces lacrimifluminis TaxID=1500077 RepID=A0A917KGH2_9ACTN|nr:hypothetical protein GCM10012282_02070 [Streptomyces lacrimifluminis]
MTPVCSSSAAQVSGWVQEPSFRRVDIVAMMPGPPMAKPRTVSRPPTAVREAMYGVLEASNLPNLMPVWPLWSRPCPLGAADRVVVRLPVWFMVGTPGRGAPPEGGGSGC